MSTEQPNLHKDPVTGEMISKSSVLPVFLFIFFLMRLWYRELKRRNEQRAKEARKAEKAASRPQNTTAKPAAKQDAGNQATAEEELTPNVRTPSTLARYVEGT